MAGTTNYFELRVRHRHHAYRAAMHVLAVLFPVWGVLLPVALALFVSLLLRLPANLHWLYALGIMLGLAGSTAVCVFFALVCDDDCLRVTRDGIQFPLRFAAPLRAKLFRSWDQLAVLKVRWSGASTFAPNEFLGFVFNDGSAVRVNLLDFYEQELQQFLGAVKNCAVNCELDPEFAQLARTSLITLRADDRTPADIRPIALGAFGMKYGARSVVGRWFREYWTPLDRLLAPWVLASVLGAFLMWGPQLLLWLVGFLPMAQLGNSGASLLAHNVLLGCAGTALLWAALALLKPLIKPTQLVVSQDGIEKIWQRGIVCLRGRRLSWNEVIAVYILSRGRLHDKCRIVFATSADARAFSIANREIPDEHSRKLLAEALRSLAGSAAIAADVFDVLTPCRTLSLSEIWDMDAASPACEAGAVAIGVTEPELLSSSTEA